MKVKLSLLCLALNAMLVGAVYAELRIWTDKGGKTIEAEHVRTLTNEVVLRRTDGTEIRVSLDTLSERDRKYAILQTPPRISINVSIDADRSNTGVNRQAQIQEEEVQAEVTIEKTSSSPYEVPLRATVVLIGEPEQSDHCIILNKQNENFSFSEGSEVRFKSGKISLRQLESGRERGVEYKGYIVAIMDKAGDILELKCSKLEYKKNAEALLSGSRGTVYDENYNVVGQKKNPNKQSQPNNPKKSWRRGL